MNIDELKNLIGTLSKGELETIKAAIEQQSKGAEIIDSIKNVFNSGHIIELLIETGNDDIRIYTDGFVSATPYPDNNVEIVLSLINGGEISFTLDTSTNWCFSKATPYYNVTWHQRPQIENIGFLKSLIVCKINRGTFNTSNTTPMDFVIKKKLSDIKHDAVTNQVPAEKIDTTDRVICPNTPVCTLAPGEEFLNSSDEEFDDVNMLTETLKAVEKWINKNTDEDTKKRHLIVEVDQTSTHKNDNSSVTRRNLYTLSFQKMSFNGNLDSVIFYTSTDDNCKSKFTPNLLPFVNGDCYWDKKSEQLVITNEDNTHTIKIRFMNPDGTFAKNEILPDDIDIEL